MVSRSLRYDLASALYKCKRLLRRSLCPDGPRTFRILLFHNVSKEQRRAFERLLCHILDTHGVISPGEVDAVLSGGGTELLTGRCPVLLTFDDGFRSHADLAKEILDRYGIKALFFVCAGLIDIPTGCQREAILKHIFAGGKPSRENVNGMTLMTWPDVEDLVVSGHTVGSHTNLHPRLSTLAGEKVQDEIVLSADCLADKLQVPVRWFAFPFGDIRSVPHHDIFEIVSRRYRYCCSGIRGANSVNTHRLALLRESIDLASPFEYQKFIIEGGWDLYYLLRARRLRRLAEEGSAESG